MIGSQAPQHVPNAVVGEVHDCMPVMPAEEMEAYPVVSQGGGPELFEPLEG